MISQGRSPDLHPACTSANLEFADVVEGRRLAQQHEASRFPDEARMSGALCQTFDARCRVHGVADHRVLEPVLRADVARHEQAAVDPYAHPKRFLDAEVLHPDVELLEARAEHLLSCGERAI